MRPASYKSIRAVVFVGVGLNHTKWRSISTSRICCYSSSSSSSSRFKDEPFERRQEQLQPPDPRKLYHKDWLSPNEVVRIFNVLQPNSVLDAFNHVSKRRDFEPTLPLYTVLINKLAQSNNNNNLDALDRVFKLVLSRWDLRLSEEIFHHVIRAFGNQAGFIDRAVDTLYSMSRYNCCPSVKTFNLVLNQLVSSNNLKLVHQVFKSAPKLCVAVDACSLNIMIKGLCKAGLLQDALHMLDEYPRLGLEPTVMTYSTIMNCMCNKGQVDDAFELLGRMEKQGIYADVITFNVLVSGLQKQGKVDEAMKLLDRMNSLGCKPNKGTYQEVLYGLLQANRFAEAKDFVHTMRSNSLIPSFSSYKALIEGLSKTKVLEDVEWVLKSMALVGFVPKPGMWSNLLAKVLNKHDTTTIVCLRDLVRH